jgi:hypothetical protein
MIILFIKFPNFKKIKKERGEVVALCIGGREGLP